MWIGFAHMHLQQFRNTPPRLIIPIFPIRVILLRKWAMFHKIINDRKEHRHEASYFNQKLLDGALIRGVFFIKIPHNLAYVREINSSSAPRV